MHLVRLEGEKSERIATLSTGGKMAFHFNTSALMYYFLGTMADPEEVSIVKLLHRALRKGDVFFDVGANVGFYTFFALPLCGDSGSVHAFEANPVFIPNLLRSVELNSISNCAVVNAVAVGKRHGEKGVLHLPSDSRAIGIASTYLHDWLDRELRVQVPLVSIDGYMQEKNITQLDVVKIDVEGGELDVFKGMHETFQKRTTPLIVCELMPKEGVVGGKYGYAASSAPSPVEVLDFLHEQGYEPRHIRMQDGRLDRMVTRDELSRLSHTINVAFVCPKLQQSQRELFAGD
jgi:FkbM family methyltransferase